MGYNTEYDRYNKYSKYNVKRVVRSFRDLDVYQITLGASVVVAKDVKPKLEKLKFPFLTGMVDCAMNIPLNIGEAHSIRFGDHKQGILLLERAMAGCNKMVVYLELAEGIWGYGSAPFAKKTNLGARMKRKNNLVDPDLIDDLIRRYSEVRTKIFRLEKSWQKWTEPRRP